jgi:hypothetical protein
MPVDASAAARARARFVKAGGAALAETLTEVVFPIADRDVPRETETLADSAQVTGPTEGAGGVGATFSYGRDDDRNPKTGEPSAAYSIAVHEEIGKQHPVGHAKWLENAGTQVAPRYAGEVAGRMRGKL